jgi:hypothetical protein
VSIFFPPPPPFVGGAQPYAPSPLDPLIEAATVNPPPGTLGGPVAIAASLVAQAQPPIWPYECFGAAQPYATRMLNAALTAVEVDSPPFSQTGGPVAGTAEVVAQAQPPIWPYVFIGSWQPYAPAKLDPQIANAPTNNPPFSDFARMAALQALTVAQAQPPLWSYEFFAAAQPYAARTLNPSVTAVTVNNPPFDRRQREQMVESAANAQPPAWPFQFLGGKQPYAGSSPKIAFSYQVGRGFIIT